MITVYGSINLDLVAPVDAFPAAGETVLTERCLFAPGGKGANQAVAAARAGAAVRMAGAVGADGMADAAMQGFRDAGVETAAVARLSGEQTAVACVMVDAAGENRIVVASNANRLVPALSDAILASTDILLMQMEIPLDRIERALRGARAQGVTTLLNLAPFAPVEAGLLDLVDILVVNQGEAAALADHLGGSSSDPSAVALSLGAYCREVVITLGAAGFLHARDGNVTAGPALPVDVVDTTGAGDAFCGCLAAALDGGVPMADALRFAAAGASLACRALGAQGAYASKSEIATALL